MDKYILYPIKCDSLTIVYSIIYSGADQRKYQSSASLVVVRDFTGDRWIPRTNGQLRGKCFHLMTSSWCRKNILDIIPSWWPVKFDVEDLAKSWSGKFRCRNAQISLRYDIVVDTPAKFQRDWKFLHTNLERSRLCEILQWDVLCDVETAPVPCYQRQSSRLLLSAPIAHCSPCTTPSRKIKVGGITWLARASPGPLPVWRRLTCAAQARFQQDCGVLKCVMVYWMVELENWYQYS